MPEQPTSARSMKQPRLPPRWFIRSFWYAHRAVLRVSGGRLGCGGPSPTGGARCVSPPSGDAAVGSAVWSSATSRTAQIWFRSP